jgi:hypothetical protein
MTTPPWAPFGRIAEAEQRLAASEEIYRMLLAALHIVARRDPAARTEAAVAAALDLALDLSVSSGWLWASDYDIPDAMRSLADQLEARRAQEPPPPGAVHDMLSEALRG